MSELYGIAPHMIPKPYAWGELEHLPPGTFFYLCEDLDLVTQMPDPKQLARELANLHRINQSLSKRFNFYMPTFDGKFLQNTGWNKDWSPFFAKLLKCILDIDAKVNGHWDELEHLSQRVLDQVIPRLLDGLLQDGEPIKPTLIHGDLWEGNIGMDRTWKLYQFDACCFYAHHGMELGIWRADHHRMKNDAYTQEYLPK